VTGNEDYFLRVLGIEYDILIQALISLRLKMEAGPRLISERIITQTRSHIHSQFSLLVT
jgi:hypothetical protein